MLERVEVVNGILVDLCGKRMKKMYEKSIFLHSIRQILEGDFVVDQMRYGVTRFASVLVF